MSNTTEHIEVYTKTINTRVSEDMKKQFAKVAKNSKRKASDYARLLYQFAIENNLEL